MDFRNRFDGIEKDVVLLIKSKAWQLVGKHGFTVSDREDIEQELMLDLLRRLRRFNPKRAKRKRFVNRVIDHGVARLVEYQNAEMRDYSRHGGSLSKKVDSPEGERVERAELLDVQTCHPGRADEETCQLEIDVEAVVAQLPGELRTIAIGLKTETVAGLARKMDIPRATLQDLVVKLRWRFAKGAMRKYL
jgi:DNA-directed RNA polymerase specialized sigma24 family protein